MKEMLLAWHRSHCPFQRDTCQSANVPEGTSRTAISHDELPPKAESRGGPTNSFDLPRIAKIICWQQNTGSSKDVPYSAWLSYPLG
jgi:hypothetical protein